MQTNPVQPQEDDPVDRRRSDRVSVLELAYVRVVPRPGEQDTRHSAAILDISVYGAGIRTTGDAGLADGDEVELGVSGVFSRARVVWVHKRPDGAMLAGLAFSALHAEFVPALLQWLATQPLEGRTPVRT